MHAVQSLTLTLVALLAPWCVPRRRGRLDCIDLTPIQTESAVDVVEVESQEVIDSLADVDPPWCPVKEAGPMLHLTADVHAKRLYEWICEGSTAPFQLLSEDVKTAYEDMLVELWWAPPVSAASGDFRESINVSWTQIAGALGVLAARPSANKRGKSLNSKPYVWVATSEGQKRKRVFWFDASRVKIRERQDIADSVPLRRRRVA